MEKQVEGKRGIEEDKKGPSRELEGRRIKRGERIPPILRAYGAILLLGDVRCDAMRSLSHTVHCPISCHTSDVWS
eukprot:1219636-Rhodomonas_salina.1